VALAITEVLPTIETIIIVDFHFLFDARMAAIL
jgi:hypothetical protein